MRRYKLHWCTKLNGRSNRPRFTTTGKLMPRKLEMMSQPLRKKRKCKRISSTTRRINMRLRLELSRLSLDNSKMRPDKTRIESLQRRSCWLAIRWLIKWPERKLLESSMKDLSLRWRGRNSNWFKDSRILRQCSKLLSSSWRRHSTRVNQWLVLSLPHARARNSDKS